MDELDSAASLPDDGIGPETERHESEAALLTEADFVPNQPLRRPGPGLPESLLWVFGLVALQIVGGIFGLVLAIVSEISKSGSQEMLRRLQDPTQQDQFVQLLLKSSPVALFCGVQSVFLLGAVMAAVVRLNRNLPQSLPLRRVPIPHAVIVGLLIVPLMFTGDSLFRYALEYWEIFVSHFPQLKGLSESSSMDQIALLVPKASLPLLLFLIAFVPAVAEELIFRGVIGRGLVARWGVTAGVLITSIMFAAVHVHPVHAFALMPLAICIHLAYLSTRSFWTPMAMHFVNNGCAVFAIKMMGESSAIADQAESAAPSLVVFVAAGLLILALTTLLWQMRVQFILPNGRRWYPGYDGADVPVSQPAMEQSYARPDWRLLAVSAVCGIVFLSAVVASSIETATDAV